MQARRDYTALLLIVVLGALEAAGTYLLIGVETPITPYARRLTSNAFGLFALAMIVFTVLAFGMFSALSLADFSRRYLAYFEGGPFGSSSVEKTLTV